MISEMTQKRVFLNMKMSPVALIWSPKIEVSPSELIHEAHFWRPISGLVDHENTEKPSQKWFFQKDGDQKQLFVCRVFIMKPFLVLS